MVVGGEDDGGAAAGPVPHHIPRIPPGQRVEARRRLVEEEQRGVANDPALELDHQTSSSREQGLSPPSQPSG